LGLSEPSNEGVHSVKSCLFMCIDVTVQAFVLPLQLCMLRRCTYVSSRFTRSILQFIASLSVSTANGKVLCVICSMC